MTSKLVGYRLEVRTGDHLYLSPESYGLAVETGAADCDTHGLFTEPQPGCSSEIEVYKGTYWVRPKNVYGRDLSGSTPLYRGPLIHSGSITELEALLHPGILELKLQRDHPDLF